jgi:hypothetical protein
VSRFLVRNNGLVKPFLRGKKVVDLIDGYWNLSILDELEKAVKRLST